MNIGDKVTPKTPAGLWLAKVPVNGEYDQQRETTVVFSGVGEVIDTASCVIDYDEWDTISSSILGRPEYENKIGKVTYHSVLIRADNGEGWAGVGALLAAS